VLAVIPYLHGLYLDAEDALTRDSSNVNATFRVAVLALPRISNHTDFDSLRLHPDVNFQWVGPNQNIPACDLLIIPGSKNTRADLQFLRDQQWDKGIQKHLRYGGKVIGICGGFQMLGEIIHDPDGVESTPGSSVGLGYFAMQTELTREKVLQQQKGLLWDKNTPIAGYEIHTGISHGEALSRPVCYLESMGEYLPEGAISEDDAILGTYLHGLFDQPAALTQLLNWAGMATAETVDINQQREQSLERLAAETEAVFVGDFLQQWSNR
jgi:adenosylcobyric acid synthase